MFNRLTFSRIFSLHGLLLWIWHCSLICLASFWQDGFYRSFCCLKTWLKAISHIFFNKHQVRKGTLDFWGIWKLNIARSLKEDRNLFFAAQKLFGLLITLGEATVSILVKGWHNRWDITWEVRFIQGAALPFKYSFWGWWKSMICPEEWTMIWLLISLSAYICVHILGHFQG